MHSHYRHVMAEDDDDDDVFRLKKMKYWMDGWMDSANQPTNQADIKM